MHGYAYDFSPACTRRRSSYALVAALRQLFHVFQRPAQPASATTRSGPPRSAGLVPSVRTAACVTGDGSRFTVEQEPGF